VHDAVEHPPPFLELIGHTIRLLLGCGVELVDLDRCRKLAGCTSRE
jgi:hypothetical protein